MVRILSPSQASTFPPGGLSLAIGNRHICVHMRNTGLHLKDVGVRLVCDDLSWTEGMPTCLCIQIFLNNTTLN